MTWEYDPIMQASCLVAGRYRCTVRHTASSQWLAVISYEGQGADAYSFDTQTEAQAELTASRKR